MNGVDLNKNKTNIPFVRDDSVYEILLKSGKTVYSAYIEIAAEKDNNKTIFRFCLFPGKRVGIDLI